MGSLHTLASSIYLFIYWSGMLIFSYFRYFSLISFANLQGDGENLIYYSG